MAEVLAKAYTPECLAVPRTASLFAALLLAPLSACGGEAARPEHPEVQSSVREREYANLRARWFAADPSGRAKLEEQLRGFMVRAVFDRRAHGAGLLLAFAHIERGEFAQAERLIARAGGPASSDLATVTQAALLIRAQRPDRALELLEPLRGKVVDPDERLLYGEQRVRALLDAGRNEDAVTAMLDWLVQAPPDGYDAVRKSVEALVDGIPTEDLLGALGSVSQALADQAASAGLAAVCGWLKKVLYLELEARAREGSDAVLARRLLPHTPPGLRASNDFAALSRLAAAGSSSPHIAGRAVGLFLSVGSAEARRRSAALSAGVARELARLRPNVELFVRDDAGSPERTHATLSALASDGAAILIAGVDDPSATLAAVFAERARIPLLLVREPEGEAARHFAFVLGASDAAVSGALLRELEARGRRQPVRVGDGGASCEASPGFAGGTRFPVDEWRRSAADAVLVLGEAGCAKDVVLEVEKARLGAVVACSFECSELVASGPVALLGAAAGSFPARVGGRKPVGWYEALGRDAAALAHAALADFPEQRVMERARVGELHERARSALTRVEVELWTSELRGFAGGRALSRTIRVVDGGAVPGLKGKP